ncbi:MAG: ribosome recycling factor [Chitinophagaceae bacterium]
MIEQQISQMIQHTTEFMQKAVKFLENELMKIRAGKASPQMFESVSVDYYGNKTALSQVANITIADAKTLVIQPWEKNLIQPIEKAIMAANLGVTPQNDGSIIRIFMPPLTEERRKELIKHCQNEAEQAKVVVRNTRRDAVEQVKKLKKEGLSEDTEKNIHDDIQKLTDKYIGIIDYNLAVKEQEMLMV